MLNKGKTILSEEWIEPTITPSKTAGFYGYLWWISPKHLKTTLEDFAAMGDLGQLAIVYSLK